MTVTERITEILRETLELGERADRFDADTRLFGSLAEFDSMAVVGIVVAIEDAFDIEVDGEEISAETFDTLGSLVNFVESKIS